MCLNFNQLRPADRKSVLSINKSVLFSNSESTDVFTLCERTVTKETKVQMCTYVKSNLQ
jgi:hypothetical protein